MTVPASLVLLLGAYLGNPDNSSAANEAIFEAAFSDFTTAVGTSPTLLNSYVDYRQPITEWVGNSDWAAASFAASADANNATPVIGLPLASIASGSSTPDVQFQDFASGNEDSVITGIVQAWTNQGFKNLVFRPGWEMNISGPTYAGNEVASDVNWVKAFQRVYTVLHAAASAAGANVTVIWNPSITNYSLPVATTSLYPGDAYVDAVGADMYADIYPYSDTSSPKTYHDWDTGGEDTTVAQFIADPINRVHYWSYPAATKWALDSSGGHSQSLAVLISFAASRGKPFVIPETGAGNSNSGTDVVDDAAFPEWLAQQLAAAEVSGEAINFVNIWDSNGGGNYAFTPDSVGKPLEAAAWMQYFGTGRVN